MKKFESESETGNDMIDVKIKNESKSESQFQKAYPITVTARNLFESESESKYYMIGVNII